MVFFFFSSLPFLAAVTNKTLHSMRFNTEAVNHRHILTFFCSASRVEMLNWERREEGKGKKGGKIVKREWTNVSFREEQTWGDEKKKKKKRREKLNSLKLEFRALFFPLACLSYFSPSASASSVTFSLRPSHHIRRVHLSRVDAHSPSTCYLSFHGNRVATVLHKYIF